MSLNCSPELDLGCCELVHCVQEVLGATRPHAKDNARAPRAFSEINALVRRRQDGGRALYIIPRLYLSLSPFVYWPLIRTAGLGQIVVHQYFRVL